MFVPGSMCARQGMVCVRRARGLCARASCVSSACVCMQYAKVIVSAIRAMIVRAIRRRKSWCDPRWSRGR